MGGNQDKLKLDLAQLIYSNQAQAWEKVGQVEIELGFLS